MWRDDFGKAYSTSRADSAEAKTTALREIFDRGIWMLNSSRAATHILKGGTLYTYFEIYDPWLGGPSPAAVQIQMGIFDSRTGEVINDSQPLSAAPYLTAGSSIIPVGPGMDRTSHRLDGQEHVLALGKLLGRRVVSARFLFLNVFAVFKKPPL
jgi:hypothetical protein